MVSEHASPLATLGTDDAGGQNTHVAELSAALAAAGHDVRVFTRRDSAAIADEVPVASGYTVVHVPAGPAVALPKDQLLPHMPEFGRWLAGQWSVGWRPDVAHAHFWMSGVAALRARAVAEVPVVQTFHALGAVKRRHQRAADTSPPERLAHERALGRGADLVVAQCREERRQLRRLGVGRSRIVLAPSGVDSRRFTPIGPAEPADRFRILSVGRLVHRKGFADLIRALPQLPDAECVIVGGPDAGQLSHHPVAGELRRIAVECGVSDRLRLVGAVAPADMPRWYRSASVVAVTPWYEPFGLVPLEAMACGVPVVGTAVGGLTDTIVDGVTGILVPARDPRALGRALRRLQHDERQRLAYAVAARQRMQEHFTWRATAARIDAAYRMVATVRPTGVVVP